MFEFFTDTYFGRLVRSSLLVIGAIVGIILTIIYVVKKFI